MHRFFLTDTHFEIDGTVDLAPVAHQLRSVLRLQPGDHILLLDNRGHGYETEIRRLERERAIGHVLGRGEIDGEPPVSLILYQCALKADKFEWVLQKATEIGVTHFVPVISSRTIVRPADKIRKKYERWHAILREAAEQSGRGRLPELGDPLSWEEAVHHAAGVRLLPWEETASTRANRALPDIITADGRPVSLLIGPEGGISEEESAYAFQAGWRPLSLGPRLLRAETAALVAATLVIHHLEQGGR